MAKKSNLKDKVKTLFKEHGYAVGEGLMVCALSGGADSVALVLVLKELGFEVVALHCNFHLRGEESDRDEQFVRDFCASYQIPLEVKHFETQAEAERAGESIEMAARRLRYDWFYQVLRELDCDYPIDDEDRPFYGQFSIDDVPNKVSLCVAHHADDNVETMLLNLIRGAGLRGLSGMQFENYAGVLRPLLSSTRQDILDYLAGRGQDYVTDSTNADTHYRRNKIRHELLPLLREMNPSIEETLKDTMAYLSEAQDIVFDSDPHRSRTYETLMQNGFRYSQIKQIESARNGAYVIQGDYMLTKNRGSLVFDKVPKPISPTPLQQGFTKLRGLSFLAMVMEAENVNLIKRATMAFLDTAKIKGKLYLRSIQEGDRFQPFGLKGTKLVSDYLTDRKRSRIDKMKALVLCDDNGILWLVGETIDQRAAFTSQTKKALVIDVSVDYDD